MVAMDIIYNAKLKEGFFNYGCIVRDDAYGIISGDIYRGW